MSVFTVGMLKMKNMDWIPAYGPKTRELINKHGGRYVFVGVPEKFEGNEDPADMIVVLEFPDDASLNAWSEDPDYQPLKQLRFDNTSSEVVKVTPMIVPGVTDK